MPLRVLYLLIIKFYLLYSINSFADTILITSATGAFGNKIANHLASEGYNLILTGRNITKLEDIKDHLLKTYKNLTIKTVFLNFTDLNIYPAITNIADSINGIVLIGPRPSLTKNDIPSSQEWTKAFQETFIGPLECIRLLLPNVKDNSSIVVISGNTSKNHMVNYQNSNVIRLAWTGEIKNLMHFVSKRKIRVNSISPGPILTKHHIDKIQQEAKHNNIPFEVQMQKQTSNIPLNTYGTLDDVANLVSFLLSTKSSHINGANIALDGGESNAY